jgi:hypothetical protein
VIRTVRLDPADVPYPLRVGYEGTRFHAVLTDTHTWPVADMHERDGMREEYHVLELATGKSMVLTPRDNIARWGLDEGNCQVGYDGRIRFKIAQDYALVKIVFIGGKAHDLTYYLHPRNAQEARLIGKE